MSVLHFEKFLARNSEHCEDVLAMFTREKNRGRKGEERRGREGERDGRGRQRERDHSRLTSFKKTEETETETEKEMAQIARIPAAKCRREQRLRLQALGLAFLRKRAFIKCACP